MHNDSYVACADHPTEVCNIHECWWWGGGAVTWLAGNCLGVGLSLHATIYTVVQLKSAHLCMCVDVVESGGLAPSFLSQLSLLALCGMSVAILKCQILVVLVREGAGGERRCRLPLQCML